MYNESGEWYRNGVLAADAKWCVLIDDRQTAAADQEELQRHVHSKLRPRPQHRQGRLGVDPTHLVREKRELPWLIFFHSLYFIIRVSVCWLGVGEWCCAIHAGANAICHLYFSANTALCFVNDRPPRGANQNCSLGLLRRIVGTTHTSLSMWARRAPFKRIRAFAQLALQISKSMQFYSTIFF